MKLIPVHSGHHDIAYDQVWFEILDRSKRVFTALVRSGSKSFGLEYRLNDIEQLLIIIDD